MNLFQNILKKLAIVESETEDKMCLTVLLLVSCRKFCVHYLPRGPKESAFYNSFVTDEDLTSVRLFVPSGPRTSFGHQHQLEGDAFPVACNGLMNFVPPVVEMRVIWRVRLPRILHASRSGYSVFQWSLERMLCSISSLTFFLEALGRVINLGSVGVVLV